MVIICNGCKNAIPANNKEANFAAPLSFEYINNCDALNGASSVILLKAKKDKMTGPCSTSSASSASFKDGLDYVPNSLRRKKRINSKAQFPIYLENTEVRNAVSKS